MSIRRLKEELKKLAENPKIIVGTVDGNVFHWQAFIVGPENSVYEGGVYELDLKFPADYPFKPPTIRILTKIYHPKAFMVEDYQMFGLDILDRDWSPVLGKEQNVLRMVYVFGVIYDMLMNPQVLDDDRVMPNYFPVKYHLAENGRRIGSKRHWDEDDKKTAREWAIRYAGAPQKKRPKNARKFAKARSVTSQFFLKTIHKLR